MGYDVSVKFANEEERTQMRVFLESHTDILKKIEAADNEIFLYHDSTPYHAEDLSYAPKIKYGLGFHGTGIPKYIWDLCAWMSVQSSWRSKTNQVFFYYDSDKMIVTTDKTNLQNTIVHDNGIPYERKSTGNVALDNFKKLFNMGRDTKAYYSGFEELHEAWLKFQNDNVLSVKSKYKP